MPRITEMVVRNAKPPESGQYVIFDDLVKGFGFRLSQGGARSWVVVVSRDRNKKKVTIGRYPDISLSQAREAARTILAQSTLAPQKLKPAILFSAAVTRFLETYSQQHQGAGWGREVKRHLATHFAPLHKKNLSSVETSDIARIVDGLLDRPSEANHAFAAVRRFFNWAVERGLIDISPCGRLSSPSRPHSRDRVLLESELKAIWHASTSYPFGQLVRMLMLTGQRRGEVTQLKWDYIDPDRGLISLPGTITKNGRDHTIPLGTMAKSLLNDMPKISEFVFPARGYDDRAYCGWSKGKAALDRACPLPQWGLHDIRRTVATSLAALETPPHVVERLLNHASGTISGVAAIYNRFQYIEEMRVALARWEARLKSLISS
jgi:integrase